MKRRPHWDDDLITAVCATGDDGEVDYWMTSDQVYRIIAAVEDWHEAKRDARVRTHSAECWRWHTECAESLIEAQQKKIGELANQLLNEVPDSYIQMKARALTAEAAIERVREFLADKDEGLTDDMRAQGHFILVDTDSVRRALDGGAK